MSQLTSLKNKAKGVVTAVVLSAALSGAASTVSAAELSVNVKDISRMQGHLMVALYKGKEAYDSGKASKAQRIKVNKENHLVTFKDIPDGEYAVKLYHDDNDNNKMDSNMFGIPKEGYGFSNNGGRFGAPDYSEAKITVSKNMNIEITLL